MQLEVYLNFDNGNCQEALDFYQNALNGNVTTVVRASDMKVSPHDIGMSEEQFEEYKNYIIHAVLEFGDNKLYAADIFPGFEHQKGNNVSITILFDTLDELNEIYSKLSKDCNKVVKPLAPTEWAEQFGMIIDKYGISWVFNYYGSKI
ncbi:MAG: VOC family protein [Solitalea-like symbiont of Tyrophagus putrescentiae]